MVIQVHLLWRKEGIRVGQEASQIAAQFQESFDQASGKPFCQNHLKPLLICSSYDLSFSTATTIGTATCGSLQSAIPLWKDEEKYCSTESHCPFSQESGYLYSQQSPDLKIGSDMGTEHGIMTFYWDDHLQPPLFIPLFDGRD